MLVESSVFLKLQYLAFLSTNTPLIKDEPRVNIFAIPDIASLFFTRFPMKKLMAALVSPNSKELIIKYFVFGFDNSALPKYKLILMRTPM